MLGEIFQYDFFRRALVAGTFLSCAAALLGLFLILRKDAMMGHGLTHIAFAGVALALLFNLAPFPVALLISALAAFLILKVRERAGLYGDTAIAILSSLGMALGIILASLSNHFNVTLLSFLFGNILAVSHFELYSSVALALIVIVSIVLFYHELLYTTFDEESARAGGLPVGFFDALLAVLTAITVVIGMKIVGLLLVSALLVIPAAAALQVSPSFRVCVFLAALFGIASTLFGIISAWIFNLPASGAIVLCAGIIFSFCFLWRHLHAS
ncbi:metal ABC transporter permease [Thermodesulfatator atlanticus]